MPPDKQDPTPGARMGSEMRTSARQLIHGSCTEVRFLETLTADRGRLADPDFRGAGTAGFRQHEHPVLYVLTDLLRLMILAAFSLFSGFAWLKVDELANPHQSQ